MTATEYLRRSAPGDSSSAARRRNEALLTCGVLAAIWYAMLTAFVGTRSPGYSALSQTVSELSAVGAPTRRLWSILAAPYTLLILAFGWGVWTATRGSRTLRIVGAALLAQGALGFIWPFAPMHLRETLAAGGATGADTLHIVLGAVTVLLNLTAMSFGAAALGPAFRRYSIASIALLATFGYLTFLAAPDVAANRPTPWLGLCERIDIAVFMLWQSVLGVALIRRQYVLPSTQPVSTSEPTNA